MPDFFFPPLGKGIYYTILSSSTASTPTSAALPVVHTETTGLTEPPLWFRSLSPKWQLSPFSFKKSIEKEALPLKLSWWEVGCAAESSRATGPQRQGWALGLLSLFPCLENPLSVYSRKSTSFFATSLLPFLSVGYHSYFCVFCLLDINCYPPISVPSLTSLSLSSTSFHWGAKEYLDGGWLRGLCSRILFRVVEIILHGFGSQLYQLLTLDAWLTVSSSVFSSVKWAWEAEMQCVFVFSVTELCPTLYDTMDCSPPDSSVSMGCPRQEYWSGLPFPSPGDPPTQGSNLRLLHWQVHSLPLGHLGSLYFFIIWLLLSLLFGFKF